MPTVRSGAAIASPSALIESEDVFVATIAPGRRPERAPEDRRLQRELLGERLDEHVCALGRGRRIVRGPQIRSDCASRPRQARAGPRARQREARLRALACCLGVAGVEHDVVPAERVLAPDLRAHEPRTHDRHAHEP